jgi:hypothetical protein
MMVEETMEHLFFSSHFSSWCWSFLHIFWDMNMHIFDRIVHARRDFGRKLFREILIVACWALWKHINEVIFDEVNLSLTRWKFIFKEELRLVLFRARPSLK